MQCDDDVGASVAVRIAQGEESAAAIEVAARAEVKEVIRVLQRNDQAMQIGDRVIPRRRAAFRMPEGGFSIVATPEGVSRPFETHGSERRASPWPQPAASSTRNAKTQNHPDRRGTLAAIAIPTAPRQNPLATYNIPLPHTRSSSNSVRVERTLRTVKRL